MKPTFESLRGGLGKWTAPELPTRDPLSIRKAMVKKYLGLVFNVRSSGNGSPGYAFEEEEDLLQLTFTDKKSGRKNTHLQILVSPKSADIFQVNAMSSPSGSGAEMIREYCALANLAADREIADVLGEHGGYSTDVKSS